MEGFIPKEKLTAYERWEIAAFDEQQRAASEPAGNTPVPAPDNPLLDKLPDASLLPLPTPEEIEGLRADAREVGHAEGYEAGFAAGRSEAMITVRREAERLESLADGLQKTMSELEDRFADDLLALALDIAQQVVRTSLRIKPELILPLVREAMATLTSQHGHPTLYVNGEDAELIRAQLGEQFSHTAWRLVESPDLARGECRVENAGSDVEATLSTRWRRVVEAIGSRVDWLEKE